MHTINNKANELEWIYNDGGRAKAGFRGVTGDCVCRAIAIASGDPYESVYRSLGVFVSTERRSKRRSGKSHPRTGVHIPTTRRYLDHAGWTWYPCMGIGTGCKVHLRAGEVPSEGRLIVKLSKHLCAVIDGVIHDLHNPSRDGTRCVYGWWSK